MSRLNNNRLTPRSRSRNKLTTANSSMRVGNDPALLINQFGTSKPQPPQVQIQTIIKYDRTKEKELLEREKLLLAEIAELKKIIAELRAELKGNKT